MTDSAHGELPLSYRGPARVIRVLLADDHALVLEGMRRQLAHQLDIKVVHECRDGFSALDAIARSDIDVVVSDVTMPGGGPSLFETIQARSPRTRMIAITGTDEASVARQVLLAGADGLISKGAPVEQLVVAIKCVLRGYSYVCMPLDRAHMASILSASEDDVGRNPDLSVREQEVLRLLGQGLTNRQIAESLRLSVKTVQTHRTRLSQKTGLRSRAALCQFAERVGLASSP